MPLKLRTQDEYIESDHEPEKMGKFVFDADDSTIDEITSGYENFFQWILFHTDHGTPSTSQIGNLEEWEELRTKLIPKESSRLSNTKSSGGKAPSPSTRMLTRRMTTTTKVGWTTRRRMRRRLVRMVQTMKARPRTSATMTGTALSLVAKRTIAMAFRRSSFV